MTEVRDWKKDMKLCEEMLMNNLKASRAVLTETPEMPMYWLKQCAAEKERADKAEERHTFTKDWAEATVAAVEERLELAEAREKKLREAHPIDEWHEDYGDVLWWTFPIEEAPYCGNPLDSEWPGYLTHWTPIVTPEVASLYPEEETK